MIDFLILKSESRVIFENRVCAERTQIRSSFGKHIRTTERTQIRSFGKHIRSTGNKFAEFVRRFYTSLTISLDCTLLGSLFYSLSRRFTQKYPQKHKNSIRTFLFVSLWIFLDSHGLSQSLDYEYSIHTQILYLWFFLD